MRKGFLSAIIVFGGLFAACSVTGDPAVSGSPDSVASGELYVPVPPVYVFDSAFAYGNYIFASDPKINPENLPSLELCKSRWGWALNIVPKGVTTNQMYSGAGLNDIQKGTWVGFLIVNKTCQYVKLRFILFPQYRMNGINIFAGDSRPDTCVPGQFGFITNFSVLKTRFTVTFPLQDSDGDGIWLIAHANVGIPQ